MKKFGKIILSFFTAVLCVLGLASCKEMSNEDFEKAKSQLIYSGLTDKPGKIANFDLILTVGDFKVSYTAESATNSSGLKMLDVSEDGTKAVVNAPFNDETVASEDLKAKLIASLYRVEKNKEVVYGQKEFNVLIGQRARPMSYDQFVAAATDSTVAVEGVVTYTTYSSNYKNGNVYLQNEEKGGFYLYRVKEALMANLTVGTKVAVEGKRGAYSGMPQVASVEAVTVLDTNVTLPEATDLTETIKNATSIKDDSLLVNVGRKVKVTNFVVCELPEIKDGVIYSGKDYSVFGNIGSHKVTMRVKVEGADILAINELVKALKIGDNLTIEGVGEWYSGFQVTTVSAAKIVNNGAHSYSDAEKVALDKASLELPATVVAGTTLELPAAGDQGSAITWASSDETVVSAAGAVAPVEADATVTLTATLKSGSEQDTKAFEVKVSKLEASSVAKIEAAMAKLGKDEVTDLFLLEGTVVALDSSSRPYVMDKAGDVILVYNKVTFNDAKPLVGQKIKLIGTGAVYNGLYQFAGDSKTCKVLDLSGEAAAVTYPEYPLCLTGAEFTKAVLTDKDPAMNGTYVKLNGTKLVASGNHFNLTYKDGDKDVEIQLNKQSSLAADVVKTENVGQEVTVYGYSYGCNSTVARICAVNVVLGSVEDPVAPVLDTHVADFSLITESVYSDGTTNDAAKVGLSEELFTIIGSAGTNSYGNKPYWHKDKELRVYDGNTVVVTSTKTITTIKMTIDETKKPLVILVDGQAVEGVNGVYTINAKSFTIANQEKAQARVKALEITLGE